MIHRYFYSFLSLFLMVPLMVAVVSCSPALENLALKNLYPWDSVNKRLDKRGNKIPPSTASVIDLPSGGHVWRSMRRDGAITVLYLHGNGVSAPDLLDNKFIRYYLDLPGYNWTIVDYPGMGIGGVGDPTERTLVNMANEALTAALQGVSEESRVIVWGRSLGAAVASQMAKKNIDRIDRMVLISPWTSLKATAETKWLGRLIPKKFYVEHSYKTDEMCSNFTKPVFIAHGTADKLIPFDQGSTLSSCFPSSSLHQANGLGHNDIYSGKVLEEVQRFIEGSDG